MSQLAQYNYGLVNSPRSTPEELDSNLPWIMVDVNGEYVYQSIYLEPKLTENDPLRKRAIGALRRQIRRENTPGNSVRECPTCGYLMEYGRCNNTRCCF